MQIKRPLCLLAAFLLLPMLLVYTGAQAEVQQVKDGSETTLYGKVVWKEYKTVMGQKNLLVYLDQVVYEDRSGESGEVLLYMKENMQEPFMGQLLQISGKVNFFQEATNPGEFDSRQYYQILNISYRIKNAVILAKSDKYSPVEENLYQIKRKMAGILDETFSEEQSAILKTMLLGDKSTLGQEIKQLYQASGIIHVLAISGLHISMLGMGLYRLLYKCYVPRSLGGAAAVLVMILFGMMTGMGTSAVRAICMFALHMLAEIAGRTYDMLTALALAAILMLLENPLWICHSGFLLSFGAVFAIAVVLPGWRTIWMSEKAGQGLTGRVLKKVPVLGKCVRALDSGFWSGTGIAAVTLPILLKFYYVYPPYSMLLNLVVIPLMSVVMLSGVGTVVCGLVWLPLAKVTGLPRQFRAYIL